MSILRGRNRQAGQQTGEYAIAAGVVIGFALTVSPLVEKALQAKVKSSVVTLGNVKGDKDLVDFKDYGQYEPYYAESDLTTKRDDKFTETYTKGAVERKGALSKSTRTGKQIEHGADKLTADDAWQNSKGF